MKKLICVLLLVCMIPVFAAAEVDLTSMSFEDLIALQRQIVAEIMSRPEWKEVKVPAGVWKIGEDIPAGSYSISTESTIATVTIWSKEPDDYSGLVDSRIIQKDSSVGKIELKAGWTIDISATVIFAPPVSLGF